MNFVYLLPFSYFFNTRLRTTGIGFHALFEWLPAGVVVLTVGSAPPSQVLMTAILSYLAFISLYEIGYMVNDLFASHNETQGRRRGPQGVGLKWIGAWFVSRLVIFASLTVWMEKLSVAEWWSFFAALCVVFGLHNALRDPEYKAVTFLWLAWFRFMAPIIFVVPGAQLMGVGLAAAMAYAAFRLFGYLDSKNLLHMQGRQRTGFRLFFFLMPLAGALVLWPYEAAKGFLILSAYFAVAATLGTIASVAMKNIRRNK